jgi:hypothetical protein
MLVTRLRLLSRQRLWQGALAQETAPTRSLPETVKQVPKMQFTNKITQEITTTQTSGAVARKTEMQTVLRR